MLQGESRLTGRKQQAARFGGDRLVNFNALFPVLQRGFQGVVGLRDTCIVQCQFEGELL